MIIVYGGTFNPPTKAHEKIANIIISKYNPEKFIFLPVGEGYTWKDHFVSFNHRKNMLNTIFKDKIYEISELENSKDFKGTYWALNEISNTYKSDVMFVLGADNINVMDKWINYENLINDYKFIVFTRTGYDVKKLIKEKFNNHYKNFFIIELDMPISSKEFRENPKLKEILNDEVYKYIKKHNLYEVNNVKA